MLRAMLRRLWPLLFIPVAYAHAEQTNWSLTASDWARPRDADMLLQQPALRGAMASLAEKSGKRLQLRYPGGDEGSLWASELKAWLVALGLESAQIELLAGSSQADAIELVVIESVD